MIYSFDEAKKLDKAGNKAKFLIMMRREGINVPDGFVIDSDTFKEFVCGNNIDDEIDKLLNELKKAYSIENKNTSTNQNTKSFVNDKIKEISEKLATLLVGAKLSDSIEKEISIRLDSSKKYAVRSSGTKEDLDEYSFAGQYNTYLNVDSKDIFEKIIGCYKSMYSEIILTYLLDNNINTDDLGMAVIIQEMVQSEYSGICFTINPISGADKEMLIEIGEGLGDNIVSGRVAPEQYYYHWYDNKYSYNDSNVYLNQTLFEKITKEFMKIQLFFGYPCDIEFGIKDNQLYILQARRITKIKYSGIEDMWSTADFKDGGVSATICIPYMWSLYEYIWEFTLKKFVLDSKILKKKEIPDKLGEMFYARCYWNMSAVKKAMSKVIGYKEREFDSEYGIIRNYDGDGNTTKLTLKSLVAIIKMAFAQRKILKTRNENAQSYKDDLLAKYYEYKDNYDNNTIVDIKKIWYKLIKEDYMQSESTYFWQIFINTIHQSLYKDGILKYVSESDYLTLLGSIDGISHMLPFYDMWSIRTAIRDNKEAFSYWNDNSVNQIIYDINKFDKEEMSCNNDIFLAVKKLIFDYGYHSDKELDVAYCCYYEDITPFIINIKNMILLDDKFSPVEDKKRGKEEYNKILKSIEANVSEKKYHNVKDKVEKMRKMLWWREEFRDISTRFYYIIRIYTIELAKQLFKEEVLEQVEDIWFLKIEDVWNYLDKKIDVTELHNIIEKNKVYYDSYRNYMSENEIGQIFNEADKEKKTNKSKSITGLGANNGKITGIARVIESFDDIDRLQNDDILVTKFTDTGWTPKFAILSGIVTEYGGILCHAAIVSREYGIPAIVSCHNAMSLIKDGQKIMINGTDGTVTILE